MIRKYLLAGLFTLLPLVVTLWLLKVILFGLIDISRGPLSWIAHLTGLPLPPTWMLAMLSAAATLLMLFAVGLLVGNFLGRQLLAWLDEIMLLIPGVKGIYGATKQVIGAIQNGKGGSFKEVVLVEWPHPGSFTLGFLARRDCSWAIQGGETMVAVYIPTAPNPTSGYVVMLEEAKVRTLDIGPEQAFTWAVSGGVVAPTRHNASVKPCEN